MLDSGHDHRYQLTRCLLLLLGHQQLARHSIPYSHPLTQRPEFSVVLFVFPDVEERFAVLEFEVVVLG